MKAPELEAKSFHHNKICKKYVENNFLLLYTFDHRFYNIWFDKDEEIWAEKSHFCNSRKKDKQVQNRPQFERYLDLVFSGCG